MVAVVILASMHDGGLGLAAPIHQLLKDAVQFVNMSVPGDKCACLEPATRNQIQRFSANGWGVMESRAEPDVVIVNAIRIEINVRSHRAPAEEIYSAALAHHLN